MEKSVSNRVLSKADNYVADLLVPRFKVDLDVEPSLEFANLMDADRKALEEFLSVYGGYKAYLEAQVADEEAKKTTLESYFDEGFAKAGYRVNYDREEAGKKKGMFGTPTCLCLISRYAIQPNIKKKKGATTSSAPDMGKR